MSDEQDNPRNPAMRPLGDYSKLAEKLKEMARKHGLYLQGVAVIPPSDLHGPVMMQASFAVGEVATEALMDEMPEHDRIEGADAERDLFDAIIEGSKESEYQQIKKDWEETFGEG